MKVAILGYGKMGKNIDRIARAKGHDIVYIANKTIDAEELKKADVAIEFSVPEAAFQNISLCLKNKIPVVSGTTGWLDHFEEAKALATSCQSKFLYASNFSIGVNIFFKLNAILAKMMSTQPNYNVAMEEIHHTEKKDAPSGTAITLAEQIIEETDYKSWVHPVTNEEKSIPIEAFREAGVFGTHSIMYNSAIDTISIKHEAHSREGFVQGAVIAAEWLVNHNESGTFSMDDVLKL